VTLRGRDNQRNALRSQVDVPLGFMGYAPVSFDARYYRVGVTMPEGTTWKDAFGFQVDFEVSGYG